MNIKITFETEGSKLTREQLDALTTLFGGVSNPVTERQTPVKELVQKPSAPPAAPKADKGKDDAVTLEMVRAKGAELSQKSPEMKAAVKAAIGKYAPKLPEVPADKLADLLADLNALG